MFLNLSFKLIFPARPFPYGAKIIDYSVFAVECLERQKYSVVQVLGGKY